MLEYQERHEMLLDKTHPSGAEEWYCPECGRRIILRLPPNNNMTIVESGDQYASHWGSIGGLRIGSVQVAQQETERDEVSEESLRPWIEALKDSDIDW